MRYGDWMQTASGDRYWPLDPKDSEVNLFDVAIALSNICRFNGHVKKFYSVAQHSCLVHDVLHLFETRVQLLGLLHDVGEGYAGDVISPIKRTISNVFGPIEQRNRDSVFRRLGLQPCEDPPEVKDADLRLLMTEKRDVLNASPYDWGINAKPYDIHIDPWAPDKARDEFLYRLKRFKGLRLPALLR